MAHGMNNGCRWLLLWCCCVLSVPVGAQCAAGVQLPGDSTLTLLFIGDLMQHQLQIDAARNASGYDYTECFSQVKREIERADMAIGNLEVTLAGKPYTGYPLFSVPDEFLWAIKEAGVDVLLTANNHCLDRRRKGLERTIVMLDSLRMPYAGTYTDNAQREARYPLLVQQNGFRIVLLNYTYGTNGIPVDSPNVVNFIDKSVMEADIAKAKEMMPDAVIACMHWGVEYSSLPEQADRQLASWLLDKGVDHVIGSHPHVVQPMEVTTDSTGMRHLIAYSLGNYVSNMSKRGTDGGVMVKLTLQKRWGETSLVDCGYSLVWVSRPAVSGRKHYRIYPASVSADSLNAMEMSKLKLFLDDSRRLFNAYNKGISEYIFE